MERICAPKGVGPLHRAHFSCKAATSHGAAMAAVGADHGPPQLPAVASVRKLGGGGRAPVVAYFSLQTHQIPPIYVV
jgi:hypothetical protein